MFASHEQPTLPGLPAAPHSSDRTPRRPCGDRRAGRANRWLGNALVLVDTTVLQGALGTISAEIACLPTAYELANALIVLLLIEFRQLFGLGLFTLTFFSSTVRDWIAVLREGEVTSRPSQSGMPARLLGVDTAHPKVVFSRD